DTNKFSAITDHLRHNACNLIVMNNIVVEPCNRGLFGSVKIVFCHIDYPIIVIAATIPKQTIDNQIFWCHNIF
ncbi:MAG: hypothetical protein SPE85_01820, partial [Prevotella sp.]|nr:hypothetical protein [Prevotella sp.]